jgi:hypothetical protein
LRDKEASDRVRKKMEKLAKHHGLPRPKFSEEQRRAGLQRIAAFVSAAREEDIGRRLTAPSARKGKRARRR